MIESLHVSENRLQVSEKFLSNIFLVTVIAT